MIQPYIRMARPSHWFKNVFMAPGVLLVWFFDPSRVHQGILPSVLGGLVAACLIASSNYVLNEILDAEQDKHHPEKRHRPVPTGQVRLAVAYAEWLLLAAVGIGLAFAIDPMLGATGSLLWILGGIYNVRPVRLKDVAYADVLSESANNPVRLAMGWYATGFGSMPPLSVTLAYWMFGAFLMAVKRFAEYRTLTDPAQAARYRRPFARYTAATLLGSIFFYGAFFGMLSGIFMARYQIELILSTPLVAFAMAYYLHLGFQPNSPVQHPERLWKEGRLMALVTLAFALCAFLLLVDVPAFRWLIHPWVLPPAEGPSLH